MKRRRPFPSLSEREQLLRAVAAKPPALGSDTAARAKASAALELARALHHLSAARSRKSGTKVGHVEVPMHDDIPFELASYSDGVPDRGVFLVGCGVGCGRVAGSIAGGVVDDGATQAEIIGKALPDYLFTKRGLSGATVRRRVAEHLARLTPKVRRRVLGRLRDAARVRVSGGLGFGGLESGYPMIGAGRSGWSRVPGARVGAVPGKIGDYSRALYDRNPSHFEGTLRSVYPQGPKAMGVCSSDPSFLTP